jgi:hypothetical protein
MCVCIHEVCAVWLLCIPHDTVLYIVCVHTFSVSETSVLVYMCRVVRDGSAYGTGTGNGDLMSVMISVHVCSCA